jgi:hypothetical protein
MKSLDTAIKSLELVYKNPKIMLIPLAVIGLSFIFLFALGLFVGINIINIILRGGNAIDAISNLSISFLVILALVLLYLVILFLISPFITGMFISSGIQALEGKLSLAKAFDKAKKKYLSLLGVSFIKIGIFIVFLLVPLIFVLLLGSISKILLAILVILYLIFLFIGMMFLLLLLFQTDTVVFTENRKAIDAIKRSFDIGKQKFLSIIATNFFLFLLVFGISLIVRVFGIIFSFIDGVLMLPIFEILFSILVEIPVSCFISSTAGILPVVFYYNYNLKKL